MSFHVLSKNFFGHKLIQGKFEMMNRISIAITSVCLTYVCYAQINEYLKKRARTQPQIKIDETEYPSDLYTEFGVDKKGNLGTIFDTLFYFLRFNDHLLKITLNNPTNPKQPSLFWRSAEFNPTEVHQKGGFHPSKDLPENMGTRRNPDKELMVMVTEDKITADAYGEMRALSSSKVKNNKTYFRYMVQPKQVNPVEEVDLIGIDAKREFSVPGSIDSEEIVSFRKCASSLCSSIFVSKKFIEKHQSDLGKVLNANLERDEAVRKFKVT
jgi:hypothetical protein